MLHHWEVGRRLKCNRKVWDSLQSCSTSLGNISNNRNNCLSTQQCKNRRLQQQTNIILSYRQKATDKYCSKNHKAHLIYYWTSDITFFHCQEAAQGSSICILTIIVCTINTCSLEMLVSVVPETQQLDTTGV